MSPAGERVAIYPGSFDPVTNGHLDIVSRSLACFDRVVVAVADNLRKTPLFTVEERKAHLREAIADPRLEVDSFTGLLIEYVQRRQAHVVVRGLRALADFEFEFQLAHMNRRLAPNIETLFLMTGERDFFVSSSLVKEVASFGGDVSALVPPGVNRALLARRGR
ncbi:MAG: pantetheine-phosphate adenylyltransferase [Myxococcales bacterium]|nr:pantetheine-phosphate adenylyltransferase [Myxococcales bacterium]